jgi:integrase
MATISRSQRRSEYSGRPRLLEDFCALEMAVAERPPRSASRTHLPFQVHAHTLRHAARANAGKDNRSIQAYLGHKDIGHPVRYTELSSDQIQKLSWLMSLGLNLPQLASD